MTEKCPNSTYDSNSSKAPPFTEEEKTEVVRRSHSLHDCHLRSPRTRLTVQAQKTQRQRDKSESSEPWSHRRHITPVGIPLPGGRDGSNAALS